MRRPLVFVQRFPKLPGRVEFTMAIGEQTYSHWYDEEPGLSLEESLAVMARELHTFASMAQDRLAATL